MAEAGSGPAHPQVAQRNLTSHDHRCCVTIIAVSQGYSPGGVWTVVGRWHFLVVVAVSILAFATTAQASPVFLSAIDISDAGQDGFGPQVEIDARAMCIPYWTRSDGTIFRIQYSTRTPSGAWSAPVNISDPGQDASKPQLAIDPSGNILAVWSRSDGTNLRIQAAYKPFGRQLRRPGHGLRPGLRRIQAGSRLRQHRQGHRWSGAGSTAPTSACRRPLAPPVPGARSRTR